jgi:hypothetical protein
MNLKILTALLYVASFFVLPAVGGAEPQREDKAELSNIFVGMDIERAEEILKTNAVTEVFTEGATFTYGEDGEIESQVLGLIPVGWKMDDRHVIDVVADKQARVSEIQIFDERQRNRGKDPYQSSMVKASSVIFFGRKLVMIDGTMVKE